MGCAPGAAATHCERIRERRAEPREDMISDLVHARAENEENPILTFEEVVSLTRALLIAGNETTATALGNLLFILATRPELARALYEHVDDDRYLTRWHLGHLGRGDVDSEPSAHAE